MTDIQAFRDAFHASALSIDLRVRFNNFSPPQTPWVNVQAPAGRNLLAVMIEASIAYTASGAGSTVVASTDCLDAWLQGIEFSPTPGGGTDRIFTKTRKGTEELERLVLDTGTGYTAAAGWLAATTHIGSYARAATVAFTTAGTRTDTSELWVPWGSAGGAIRINMASLSAVFTTPANVAAVYTFGFFEVYSLYTGVVAAFENKTATLATGNYQDMIALNVVPGSLAVDIMSIVGETTTDVTQIMVNDQSGLPVVKCDTTQSINASTQYIYPQFASTQPSYNALVFFLNKTVPTTLQITLNNSVALDFLFIQVQGPTDVPANTAAQTPTSPAVQQGGSTQPGAGPTAQSNPIAQTAGGSAGGNRVSSPSAAGSRPAQVGQGQRGFPSKR